MTVLFWIICAIAIIFTIGIVVGFCTKKFIFASCMNVGLAVCVLIMNIICLLMKV